jgi:putative hemolysin
MTWIFAPSILVLLCILAVAAYIDRVYFEMGKFLSREFAENIEVWEERVEPTLLLSRDSAALSASVLRQISLGALAFLLAIRLRGAVGHSASVIGSVVFELILVLVVFDRLIPQLFFSRTRGLWLARISYLVRALFYLVLPVTLAIGLLLSIAGLAEPEVTEAEHSTEGVDALLEAGEEEGILEEHDRELVRSVVEFGDKIVREVMTPRPEVYAVASSMSLEEFTRQVNEHGFSRVPVYKNTIDEITGIVFARDMLGVKDSEAANRKVAQLQRPAAFIPESKKVNELLREMQHQKQHMSVVIDEYGGVAGIVTIEDLLEAIVGNIEDEHDAAIEDLPVAEADGVFVVPGSFEVSRLRELFEDAASPESHTEDDEDADLISLQLLSGYEAATVGGLVSEIAGHIPHPGEIIEDGQLRLEVIASTDRLVERVRLSLERSTSAPEPE